jgi:hypothetical protein
MLEYKLRKLDKQNIRAELDRGHLYKVTVPDADELLDWDKPVEEQPESIKKIVFGRLNDLLNESYDEPALLEVAYSGESVYRSLSSVLGGDTEASLLLKKAGIKGIQYLDGNSRADGEGTHNYVVFADEDIEIVDMLYQPDGGTDSADNQSMGEEQKKTVNLLSTILETGKSDIIKHHELGEITVDAGEARKKSFGLKLLSLKGRQKGKVPTRLPLCFFYWMKLYEPE